MASAPSQTAGFRKVKPRKQKKSPASQRRKESRAEERLQAHSKRRAALTQQMGGAAASEQPMKAWRGQRDARVPARIEVAGLTSEIRKDFDQIHEDRVGQMEPGNPKVSQALPLLHEYGRRTGSKDEGE